MLCPTASSTRRRRLCSCCGMWLTGGQGITCRGSSDALTTLRTPYETRLYPAMRSSFPRHHRCLTTSSALASSRSDHRRRSSHASATLMRWSIGTAFLPPPPTNKSTAITAAQQQHRAANNTTTTIEAAAETTTTTTAALVFELWCNQTTVGLPPKRRQHQNKQHVQQAAATIQAVGTQ